MISSSPSSWPSRSAVTGEGMKGMIGRIVPVTTVSSMEIFLIREPVVPRSVYTWSSSGEGVVLREVATTFRWAPSL